MEHFSFVKTGAINRLDAPSIARTEFPGANAMASAPKHILITDDDVLVQKTLKFGLEELGYTVGLAKDGRDALRYVEAYSPAAVALDVFMPDSDGLEALLAIKTQFPDVKVVMMSGGGMKGHYEFLSMARKFGADGVLRKPILARDLAAMLEPLMAAPDIDPAP